MGRYTDKGDFKKGCKPGPGRKPLPPEVKELKRLDRDTFNRKLNECLSKTKEELAEFLKNPQHSVLDHAIASIAAKAITSGDHARLDGLLGYIFPKKTEVEHSGQISLSSLITESLKDKE